MYSSPKCPICGAESCATEKYPRCVGCGVDIWQLAEENREAARDRIQARKYKTQCTHTRIVTLQTGKTVCSLCGKDVSLQFPKR